VKARRIGKNPQAKARRFRPNLADDLLSARFLSYRDEGVHRGVLAVGQASVALAKLSRHFDERGIDGAIAALVRGLRDLDLRARRLQSGFVSRDLVLAAGGALLLLVLLVFLR